MKKYKTRFSKETNNSNLSPDDITELKYYRY
jgi:hypothetical protein